MSSSSADGPDFWHARNIAEHAYCQRLFYYMQVEGVFLPSSDTEQGQSLHRRVDHPSATASGPAHTVPSPDNAPAAESADPDRPRNVRSLALSSARMQLTATLDLAEVSGEPFHGGIAIPVEYRKGRPQRLQLDSELETPNETEPGQQPLARVEPWPPDRVQLGLQVLLLEEHGYRVPHAVLYYAAERRRLVIPVDDALREAAAAELAAAAKTAAGSRPLPLLNDPKCPRCSLQPICLPDEINVQRSACATSETSAPRRSWPPRADGIHVAAQTEGVRIGVRGASLRFTDRHGQVVREMPMASMESLAIVGGVQLSTQAIQQLADMEIPVVFMTSAGRALAWLDSPGPVSARVRVAQVRRFDQPQARLVFARAIVAAKIANQRTLLMRNGSEVPGAALAELNAQTRRASEASSVETLLGHEGQAAAVYFQAFPSMLRDQAARERFSAVGRKRRPPPDPINALLSFAYAMLTHESTTALRTAMLEPNIGGYHTPRPGRPALALDLMEPFRPLIADSVVVSLINRGEVAAGHFLDTAAGCALTEHGRRAFFSAWGRRMATEVTHPVFEYRLSYRRMLMLHARLIAAWLLDEVPTLAFLTTR